MNERQKYSLPFDQFSRQMQVLGIVDALRKPGEKFTILDVGGYKGVTRSLHSHDNVTVLDVFDVHEKGYVQGDATKLVYADRSFDIVVSFDVLEHIEGQDREAFVREISRVAKLAVIIAAPVRSAGTQLAEGLVNAYYKRLHGTEHPWLAEHIAYGLPETGLAEKLVGRATKHTIVLPSNDLDLWLQMQGIIFTSSKVPSLAKRIGALQREYNRQGPFDGTADPAANYRHIVVGLHDISQGARLDEWLQAHHAYVTREARQRIEQQITETYALALQELQNDNAHLQSKTAELERVQLVLHRELADIMRSKSFRLARGLARSKAKIMRKRRSEIV